MRIRILGGVLLGALLAAAAVWRGRPSHPQGVFYITPNVDALGAFPPEEQERRLRKLLDTLEPGGPAGSVRVGYVIEVRLLDVYRRTGDSWALDLGRFQSDLGVAARLGRPIVVALHGDHFGTDNRPVEQSLSRTLLQDPANLMTFAGGKPVADSYLVARILPFTLSTDPDIPVNHYRFEALKAAVRLIRDFERQHPGLLIGVALNGETHHLFSHFESGMGRLRGIQTTDYSPRSQAEFREWLRRRGWTLERLGALVGTRFAGWEEVAAPELEDPKAPPWRYFDSYARGIAPIVGWVHPGDEVQAVEVFLDGRRLGTATLGLNRTDLYDADKKMLRPNGGFRYDLDFSGLPSGTYRLDVMARRSFGRVARVGERTLQVVNPFAPGSGRPEAGPRPGTRLRGRVRGGVETPEEGERLQFNPLARLWEDFREEQSRAFVAHLADLAAGEGLDRRLLFSYQLVPWLYGGWNDVLFGVGPSFFEQPGLSPGFTLYGELASSELPYEGGRIRRYGVPEFHPIQDKDPEAALRALRAHAERGAVFVAPYFVTLRDGKYPGELGRMQISPDNPERGSNWVYRAIVELARE